VEGDTFCLRYFLKLYITRRHAAWDTIWGHPGPVITIACGEILSSFHILVIFLILQTLAWNRMMGIASCDLELWCWGGRRCVVDVSWATCYPTKFEVPRPVGSRAMASLPSGRNHTTWFWPLTLGRREACDRCLWCWLLARQMSDANNSKMVKATDFIFDGHISRDSPDMSP